MRPGPAIESDLSERTCIVTRTVRAPEDMVRFVVDPSNGAIVPDIRRKLPGRGVWVSASAGAVREAVRKQLFARGFRSTVKAAPDLADQVDALLAADALQSLAMVNKAGGVVTGAGKVEKLIGARLPAAMIHARDGSPDGRRKIDQILHRHHGDAARSVRCVDSFVSAQLDLALGRTNVIHAALVTGSASDAFLKRCHRLETYRQALDLSVAGETLTRAAFPATEEPAGSDTDGSFDASKDAARRGEAPPDFARRTVSAPGISD